MHTVKNYLISTILSNRQFARSAVTYQGNHTPTVNSNASNLGEQLRLSATIENQGPSTIYNAKFVIYIPINSSETGNYYYFYPAVMVTITLITVYLTT